MGRVVDAFINYRPPLRVNFETLTVPNILSHKPYDNDIRKILSENAIRDIQAAEDQSFIQSVVDSIWRPHGKSD